MNSDYERKLEAAFHELSKTGLPERSYDSPFYKLLRKFGVQIKPPQYNTYIGNALTLGMLSATFFGLIIFLVGLFLDRPERFNLVSVLFFGAIFGLFYAYLYERNKKKHNLTDWENL